MKADSSKNDTAASKVTLAFHQAFRGSVLLLILLLALGRRMQSPVAGRLEYFGTLSILIEARLINSCCLMTAIVSKRSIWINRLRDDPTPPSPEGGVAPKSSFINRRVMCERASITAALQRSTADDHKVKKRPFFSPDQKSDLKYETLTLLAVSDGIADIVAGLANTENIQEKNNCKQTFHCLLRRPSTDIRRATSPAFL